MPTTIDKPGVYPIAPEVYHRDELTPEPSLSSTLARIVVNRSPLHAWTAHPRLNPHHEPTEKAAFDIGRVCHTLLLGKGAEIAPVEADNWTTKAAREARDEARAEGMTPVLAAQLEAATAMAEIARERIIAFGGNFERHRNELAAFAQIDGVWCRAQMDHVPADPRGPIWDYKTCEDASPDACVRAVSSYGYDVQAAHYLAVWKVATGEDRGFRFVFQEKAAPHEVSVVELHAGDDEADWMLDAQHKCAEARRIWGECLRSGNWPGYPPRIAVLGAPTWHRKKWEDRFEQIKPSHQTLARAAAWQSPERMAG